MNGEGRETGLEPELDLIAAMAARFFDAPACLLSFADSCRVWLKTRDGEDVCLDREGSICAHIERSAAPLMISDAAADPRFQDDALVQGPPHLRFLAGMPLVCDAGECLGSLSIADTRPRALPSAREMAQLADFARLATFQLEHRKTHAELRRITARAVRMEAIQSAIAAATSCEAALTGILGELCRFHGAAIGRIWKLLLPSDVMVEVSRFQDDETKAHALFGPPPAAPVTAANSFSATAIRNNEPGSMYYAEVQDSERYPLVAIALRVGLTCQVCYPIWVQGERFGIGLSFRSELTPLADIMADLASLEDLIRPALYRKVTEERLLLLGQALDRATDGVLITEAGPQDSPGPRIIYANAGFTHATGYSQDEIIGQTPYILKGPDTDRATLDLIARNMRQWQPTRVELLHYRKDGGQIWTELDLAPVTNKAGMHTNWVAIQRDVTERRFQEQAMLRAEKLKTIGQLTGGISHDFNNLLTIITLNIEEMMAQLPPQHDLQSLLRPAMHASIRGAELTSQLLSYARRAPLRPQLVQMEQVLGALQPLLTRALGEQYQLHVGVHRASITATVDPGQLESAIMNLVINARDAMEVGGTIFLHVTEIALYRGDPNLQEDMEEGRYAKITIADQGCGIPADILPRVFDPFFTTKEVGLGSGLGLSMVYGFAKQSGGHVTLRSRPGIGTVVTLFLPAGATEAEPAEPAPRPERWRANGRSVLVVEDQPEVLATVERILVQAGFDVRCTGTADDAALMLRQGEMFDLLFTDIVLPGALNGVDLAVVGRHVAPGMKTLIASGFTLQSMPLTREIEAGAEFLMKPYKRQDLLQKLRAMFPEG